MGAIKTLQTGLAYSQSLLSYKTNGSPRPFSASFVVSNRCNIRCSYCNFPLMKEPELTLPQVEALFKRLKQIGVMRLGLLGGEPLYRKDILEIIATAKQLGFFISLNSNLLLYDKFNGKLSDIDYFFTSLDGTPERHIKNRGKQDYDKVLAAIRHIRSTGKPLTAICVVTDYETADADYLIALAQKENITLHFQPECFDTEIVLRTANEQLNQQKAKVFWQYLLTQKQQGAPLTSSAEYFKYIIHWHNYKQSAVYTPEKRCAAGLGYLFIDATGTAYPCAYTKGKTKGINLLEENWQTAFTKKTPCTQCIVGPMLEFNLLFEKPFSSVANVLNIA
ncbi:MAG: radical SAM protein [Chitinophagales bacterium]|nr:radical SAM protein [Chitinophagales bacterium]